MTHNHDNEVFMDLKKELTPPPSPLGRDFARQTAAAVLRRAQLEPTDPEPPSGGGGAGWKVDSGPIYPMVRRWSTSSSLINWHSLILFALYALPCLWAFQFLGERDTVRFQGFYFAGMWLGLCIIVPGYLLSRSYDFYQRLVRGRGLEEMVQAGLAGPSLVDGFVRTSAWTCAPILTTAFLCLAPSTLLQASLGVFNDPLLPELLSHRPGSGVVWWPILAVILFVSGCYVLQAHLLESNLQRSARRAWLEGLMFILGSGLVWHGSLLQSFSSLSVGAILLLAAAYRARATTLRAFDDLTHCRTILGSPQRASLGRPKMGAVQKILRSQLSAYPLAYLDLGRTPLVTWRTGLLLAAFYLITLGNFDVSLYWVLATALGCGLACQRMMRERSSRTLETLLQSGIGKEELVSNYWILCLIRGAVPTAVGLLWIHNHYHNLPDRPESVMLLALVLGVVACLGAGVRIGVELAWKAETYLSLAPRVLAICLTLAYLWGFIASGLQLFHSQCCSLYERFVSSLADPHSMDSVGWFFEFRLVYSLNWHLLPALLVGLRLVRSDRWPAMWALMLAPLTTLRFQTAGKLDIQLLDYMAVGLWLWWIGPLTSLVPSMRTVRGWMGYLGHLFLYLGFCLGMEVLLATLASFWGTFRNMDYFSSPPVVQVQEFLKVSLAWALMVGIVGARLDQPSSGSPNSPTKSSHAILKEDPGLRFRTWSVIGVLTLLLLGISDRLVVWNRVLDHPVAPPVARFEPEVESRIAFWTHQVPRRHRSTACSPEMWASFAQDLRLPDNSAKSTEEWVSFSQREDLSLLARWFCDQFHSRAQLGQYEEALSRLPTIEQFLRVMPPSGPGSQLDYELFADLTSMVSSRKLSAEQLGQIEKFAQALQYSPTYLAAIEKSYSLHLAEPPSGPWSGPSGWVSQYVRSGEAEIRRRAIMSDHRDSISWTVGVPRTKEIGQYYLSRRDRLLVSVWLEQWRQEKGDFPQEQVFEGRGLSLRWIYQRKGGLGILPSGARFPR